MGRIEITGKARQGGAYLNSSFLILVLGMVLATACATEPESDDIQVTGEAIQEVEAAETAEIDTADGLPKTPTEEPFYKFTSQEAIDAFRAAGLGVENPTPLELDDHSPLPPTFADAQRFQIPAMEGRSGRIFSFEREGDLQAVRYYYEGFTGAQANIVIVKDNLLLQIGADAPAELADAYRDALEALR